MVIVEDHRDLAALEPDVHRSGHVRDRGETWRVSTASATSTTVMLGSARISATSSIAWWDGPPGVDTPGMKPMMRTGRFG